MSCNFDFGLCPGWSQSTADVFNWTRGTGKTWSTDTGPSSEHTSESGVHIVFLLEIGFISFTKLVQGPYYILQSKFFSFDLWPKFIVGAE